MRRGGAFLTSFSRVDSRLFGYRLLQLGLHERPVAVNDLPVTADARVRFCGVPLRNGVLGPVRSPPIAHQIERQYRGITMLLNHGTHLGEALFAVQAEEHAG
jgi:hypothetical protein